MAKAKTTSYSNEDLEHIREDLDSLRHNVVALTKSLRQDVRERAATRFDRLKERGAVSMEVMENNVREHPARSILTAFGAGLLLSALMRGR